MLTVGQLFTLAQRTKTIVRLTKAHAEMNPETLRQNIKELSHGQLSDLILAIDDMSRVVRDIESTEVNIG